MTPAYHALVDLDGTMVDPQQGIIGSVQYALRRLGVVPPPAEKLRWVVGPPLRSSFPELLASRDASMIEAAVAHYREHYRGGAMLEAAVYPGIPEALDRLRADGFTLIVATSKPKAFARPILEHFGLANRFSAIHGAELDGRNDDKAELIAHILATEGIERNRAVMIGDRKFDIVGARANGIPCVAVGWGYGSAEELEGHRANAHCAEADALLATVNRVLGLTARP